MNRYVEYITFPNNVIDTYTWSSVSQICDRKIAYTAYLQRIMISATLPSMIRRFSIHYISHFNNTGPVNICMEDPFASGLT